jgi:tRNA dimethylallyltransferase
MSFTKSKPEIIALLGPTASGKTSAAIRLAGEFGCEIISCDSRQVFRFMDIGTAKPTESEQKTARHWLIDIVEPSEMISAWDYADRAAKLIKERTSHGARLILCGGTGLYYKALTEGLSPRTPSNLEFRKKCEQRAAAEGGGVLHDELMRIDPETAIRLHCNDLQRVIRALQVYNDTGVPMSAHFKQKPEQTGIRCVPVVLSMPRDILYERINSRVTQMFSAGLYQEFLKLRSMGYDQASPGMECVGYKEFFDVENSALTLAGAVGIIQQHTRNFAKRQITWFSNTTPGFNVNMMATNAYSQLKQISEKYLDS